MKPRSALLPPYVFDLEIGVRDYEVDVEGIVNNAVYLNYMEHTRHEFCRQAGLTFAEMHRRGLDPVLTRAEVDYKTPLRLGDAMLSRLGISRRGPLFVFRQDIYRLPDMEPVARGVISVACLRQGCLCRGDELAEAFAAYLQPSPASDDK